MGLLPLGGRRIPSCPRGRAGWLQGATAGFRPGAVTRFRLQLIDGLKNLGDRASFGRFLRDEQPGPPGLGDEFPGRGEEPVAPPFHIASTGRVSGGQGGELQPGDEVHGQEAWPLPIQRGSGLSPPAPCRSCIRPRSCHRPQMAQAPLTGEGPVSPISTRSTRPSPARRGEADVDGFDTEKRIRPRAPATA